MEAVKRTRMSPEERRAQLIDLGARMLAERPLEQISVEEIADQAGVSRGLLFHYFASKHDYHLAIVQHAGAEMLVRTEPDLTLPPLEILRSSVVAYVDYVSDNRNSYVSLLRGAASGDPEMRDEFERTRSALAARIMDQLPRLGIEPGDRIALAVRGWIAFVEETAISWLREPVISREELIDLIVTALPAVTLPAPVAAALLGQA
ncbi:TetR/AcrR family transcriptional regulator [Rhodococcus tukisamuensis]|uniref:DNA-binding transcriptional regulator, AcrR family n=1 Tax=Rhodococcus tukisamuensis TaxID=168276 RepID=A0A1G7CK01_9NOCA|nr:TetR/AcrR family transcriptional regulator [Rhodococcus tukisamuensis]SDE39724.1 DNA-binding transcriptional regulator, AcrR family [Rhodococcus tukisamuensis]